MQVFEDQRTKHLQRNSALKHDAVFTASDMQEINKCWMEDHENWMNQKTLENYNCLREGRNKRDQQKARQMRRNTFSPFSSSTLDAVLHSLPMSYSSSCKLGSWSKLRTSTRKEYRSPTGRRRNAET